MHTTIRLEYERLSRQLEEVVGGDSCGSELAQYMRVIGKYRIAGNFRWCKFSRICLPTLQKKNFVFFNFAPSSVLYTYTVPNETFSQLLFSR